MDAAGLVESATAEAIHKSAGGNATAAADDWWAEDAEDDAKAEERRLAARVRALAKNWDDAKIEAELREHAAQHPAHPLPPPQLAP